MIDKSVLYEANREKRESEIVQDLRESYGRMMREAAFIDMIKEAERFVDQETGILDTISAENLTVAHLGVAKGARRILQKIKKHIRTRSGVEV